MNPVEIGTGTSFKGLSAYLLNDVRQEATQEDAQSLTQSAERVGWTQTHNLDDTPPDRAWRMMLATANSAPDLKEAAGIKKGKPVKNTVWHYAITFPPDEQTTPELEQEAVRSSLEALGLQDHQALAVRHTDTAHAHIHVMVNLIDPTNGMSAATPQMQANGKKASKLSNTKRKFSTWAAKFERDHGLTMTEGRRANRNARERGETVNAQRKPRNVYERGQTETQDDRRDWKKDEFAERAKAIQAKTERQKMQQRIDWDALKKSYAFEKTQLKRRQPAAIAERTDAVERGKAPTLQKMLARHEHERRMFEMNDRTAIGKIWHASATFKELAKDSGTLGAFVGAFSRQTRRKTIWQKQNRERASFAREVKADIAAEERQIRRDYDHQLAEARNRFTDRWAELKARHDIAWSEIRDSWRLHNADRAAALGLAQERAKKVQQKPRRRRGQGRGLKPEL